MYKRNKSIKLQLSHLNSVYFIFRKDTEDIELINERLKNYILSDIIYSDEQIKEAKEKYERSARNSRN